MLQLILHDLKHFDLGAFKRGSGNKQIRRIIPSTIFVKKLLK